MELLLSIDLVSLLLLFFSLVPTRPISRYPNNRKTFLSIIGDHFKSLLPLFSLYRVSSLTPSNRSLLLETLKRQLSTPLLFGESQEEEVGIWLDSLPIPSNDEDDHDTQDSAGAGSVKIIEWFEKVVQKTLTAPIKPNANKEQEEEESSTEFSPLMKNALISLISTEPSLALQLFIRNLFVAYLSYSTSLVLPTRLFESIKTAWKEQQGGKEVKSFFKGLSDVLEIVKGGKEKKLESGNVRERIEAVGDNEEELKELLKGLNPRRENVFVAYEDDQEKLKQ